MKATMFFLMLFVGVVAYGQSPDVIDYDGDVFVLTETGELEAVADTIPGWGLVTHGDKDVAQQEFIYRVDSPYLLGRDRHVQYLDVWRRPLGQNVIVWQFQPYRRR